MARPLTTDFDDTPLVLGSIHGVRSFTVRHGELYGPIVSDEAFTSGVNTAVCHAGHEEDPCPGVATLDCSSGYYAYFDSSEMRFRNSASSIDGIIEGTGRVTVGSLGMRCEKARVVALVDPLAPYRQLGPIQRAVCWLISTPTWYIMRYSFFMMVFFAISIAMNIMSLKTVVMVLNVYVALAFFMSFAISRVSRTGKDSPFVNAVAAMSNGGCGARDVKKLKKRYPDVAWYGSLDEACRHYPLLSTK